MKYFINIFFPLNIIPCAEILGLNERFKSLENFFFSLLISKYSDL